MAKDETTIISRVRKRLGWTQAQLAQKLGVKQNTISQYETGTAHPSIQVLLRLLDLTTDGAVTEQIRHSILGSVRYAERGAAELLQNVVATATANKDVQKAWDALVQEQGEADRLLDEVRRLIECGTEIDPSLTRIVQLYRESAKVMDVPALLRKVLCYLEVEIGRVARITSTTATKVRPGK